MVKLVLRGPPQLQHVTFVHMAPDHETVAQSQFGLYIPRDGKQRWHRLFDRFSHPIEPAPAKGPQHELFPDKEETAGGMIGTFGFNRRRMRMAVGPSITGIVMSVSTAAICWCSWAKIAMASAPLAARTTR